MLRCLFYSWMSKHAKCQVSGLTHRCRVQDNLLGTFQPRALRAFCIPLPSFFTTCSCEFPALWPWRPGKEARTHGQVSKVVSTSIHFRNCVQIKAILQVMFLNFVFSELKPPTRSWDRIPRQDPWRTRIGNRSNSGRCWCWRGSATKSTSLHVS